MTTKEKKLTRKKIKATKMMKQLMSNYYFELDAAAKSSDKKVAWCSSVGPAEILRSLGFYVYFPENHSAMLGTSKIATDLIPFANAAGYSPEICSYLTSDIGAYLRKVTPLSKAYEGMGESYAKKGMREKAREFYEKSLEIDPENNSAKQKLENLGKDGNT